ncbi:hypothetical protein D782_2451 [Enterobacteriaceae bacterium strain FGI 57]|jgi:hypothetical protein|nr:hypothetical protein D782_2451 [Enterobacteriaceae bacterium strain FGI 57]
MCTNYLVIAAAAVTSFILEMDIDVHTIVQWFDPWLDALREWARYSDHFLLK